MSEITRDYYDNDKTELHRIHNLARPIELEGSCDARAFLPLSDDKAGLAEFNHSRKFVTMIDGRIVGFIGIDDNTVGWLYVDPADTGQGIGRRLLKYAVSQITGVGIVYVLSENKIALALYISEGFAEVDQFDSTNNGYPCTVIKLEKRSTL